MAMRKPLSSVTVGRTSKTPMADDRLELPPETIVDVLSTPLPPVPLVVPPGIVDRGVTRSPDLVAPTVPD